MTLISTTLFQRYDGCYIPYDMMEKEEFNISRQDPPFIYVENYTEEGILFIDNVHQYQKPCPEISYQNVIGFWRIKYHEDTQREADNIVNEFEEW